MKFIEFIKEYSWLLSIVLGLLAILQTWRIWSLSKKEKKCKNLSFYFRNKKDIDLAEIPFDISLIHKNKKYKKILLVECILGNNGTVVLTSEDIVNNDIFIKFVQQIDIIDYKIISKTENDLNIKFSIDKINSSDILRIKFDTIDAKSAIKLNILLYTDSKEINAKLHAKIRDENYKNQIISKKITYEYQKRSSGAEGIIVISLLFFYGYGIYKSFIITQKIITSILNNLNLTKTSIEIISIVIGIIPPLIIIYSTYKIIKWIIKKDLFKETEPSVTPFDKSFKQT